MLSFFFFFPGFQGKFRSDPDLRTPELRIMVKSIIVGNQNTKLFKLCISKS